MRLMAPIWHGAALLRLSREVVSHGGRWVTKLQRDEALFKLSNPLLEHFILCPELQVKLEQVIVFFAGAYSQAMRSDL